MYRYHTDQEIRSYDLMKLGVLLLLLLLLALAWFATRDAATSGMPGGEPVAAVANGSPAGEPALPMPTLVVPAIDMPVTPPQPGEVTLSGAAEPGSQLVILVNDKPAAAAITGIDGDWSASVVLPAGNYTVRVQSVDNVGNIVGESQPIALPVGDEAGAEASGEAPPPVAELVTPPAAGEAAPAEPGMEQTIIGALAARPEFSTLLSDLQTAGVTDKLNEPGPFTLFAPTNDAFAQLPQRVIDGLKANPQALSEVLQYHATLGRFLAAELAAVQPMTVNGRLLTISQQGDLTLVNDAVITETDILAGNGVIHAIDRILVPPLAEGVRPPIIDSSGVPTFKGTFLTIVGTAEPNSTILVELNGEAFGQPAVVNPEGTWSVSEDVTAGEYRIIAYMLGDGDTLLAISRPVALQVQ